MADPQWPQLTGQLLYAFCTDAARQIHDGEEIARRYHFKNGRHARSFILAHPKIAETIHELRALWQSELSVKEQLQQKSMHACSEALPEVANIAFDRNIAPKERLDAVKLLAALGGHLTGRGEPAGTGAPATRFAVQIVFQNAGKTEEFKTIEVKAEENEAEEELA